MNGDADYKTEQVGKHVALGRVGCCWNRPEFWNDHPVLYVVLHVVFP
jgi:hypothetical protein